MLTYVHTHTCTQNFANWQELPLPLKLSSALVPKSNSGSFFSSYWPTERASLASSGPTSGTGNLKSSTPRRSPAAGGNGKTNPRWTTRSSAEAYGTTMTRISSRKCRISDMCIALCATSNRYWVYPLPSYRKRWIQVGNMEQLLQ